MELLIGLAILAALDVAAWFWGADSLTPAATGANGRAIRSWFPPGAGLLAG